MRMPSAPEVVMTPAPKRLGKPCATMAGRMIEPMATTVAELEPDTAAKSAQAITPARPRPPYQWPIIDVAKAIMRFATPPWVRKLPARMKNGIAMISKFSMPVNSFRPTRLDRHGGHREQEGEDGEAERDRDRHAGEHERDEEAEDDRGVHRSASPAARSLAACGLSTTPSTWLWSWWGSAPVRQNA